MPLDHTFTWSTGHMNGGMTDGCSIGWQLRNPGGITFSFPCRIKAPWEYEIISDLELNAYSEKMIAATETNLSVKPSRNGLVNETGREGKRRRPSALLHNASPRLSVTYTPAHNHSSEKAAPYSNRSRAQSRQMRHSAHPGTGFRGQWRSSQRLTPLSQHWLGLSSALPSGE